MLCHFGLVRVLYSVTKTLSLSVQSGFSWDSGALFFVQSGFSLYNGTKVVQAIQTRRVQSSEFEQGALMPKKKKQRRNWRRMMEGLLLLQSVIQVPALRVGRSRRRIPSRNRATQMASLGTEIPLAQAVMAGALSAVVASKLINQGLSREMRGMLKRLRMLAWTII